MDNVNIPPLKFTPILKSVVWGGEKIAPFKGIVTDQKTSAKAGRYQASEATSPL